MWYGRMAKELTDVAQVRDLLLSLYGFIVSAAGFVLNHLFSQELWLTFATAAGGLYSISKAIQTFMEIRKAKRDSEIIQAVEEFAKRVEEIDRDQQHLK